MLLQVARATVDVNLFTSEAQAKLFPSKARDFGAALNSISLPVAVIHMSELVERRNENGLRVYRYMLTDVGTTLFCTVKLTKDDKVADLRIEPA